MVCVCKLYSTEIVITPTGDDDATLIQYTLDALKDGDTLNLNGDFVIKHTIYLPSNFVWILNGSLTLAGDADLDEAGWVDPPIDATRRTGITEKQGGATNIDMSGGTYYGNSAQHPKSMRYINFVSVTNSKFHDMHITEVTDDNFTLGPGSNNNECRNLIGSFAHGNALTDKGDHNRWYDCIAEDCDSDGWTPKCRYSEFHRCIARRNEGPGFGMFCRIDGSGNPVDLGEAIENNKFYDCESYENNASGFSFNISSTSGEGGTILNNYVQARCYNNAASGVRFRNKQPNSIIENNEINIICYGNRGFSKSGDPSSLAGGLGTEGKSSTPVRGITGSVICFDNSQVDVNTNQATDCKIVVYNPNDQSPAILKKGGATNILTEVSFNCGDPLEKWCQIKYCGFSTPALPDAPANLTANVISSSQIDMSWTDNAEDEDGYIIEQKTTKSYTVIDTLEKDVTSFSSTDLTELTEYTYRVRAFNVSGYSDYSNEALATTEAGINTSAYHSSTGRDIVINNYPNPFHSTTRIEYKIPASCLVSLKVYDFSGRELTTLVHEEKPEGLHIIIFDGSHLSRGTYYFKLRAGDIIASRKFVLM